jgi:hypothetical protein
MKALNAFERTCDTALIYIEAKMSDTKVVEEN